MNPLNIFILLGITLGSLLLFGLLVNLWRKRNATRPDQPPVPPATSDNPYEALRRQALHIPAAIFADATMRSPVYGIIMDWHVGEGCITLACFATGESSVYFSNGGGIIGGQESESAVEAANRYLLEANQAYVSAKPVAHTELPAPNSVQFYFLTQAGRRHHSVAMQYLEDRSSPMLTLFEKANDLLTALRELQDRGSG